MKGSLMLVQYCNVTIWQVELERPTYHSVHMNSSKEATGWKKSEQPKGDQEVVVMAH